MPSTTLIAVAATVCSLAVFGCGGTDLDLGGEDLVAPQGGYEEAAASICTEVADRFAEAQAEDPRTFAQGEEVTSALLEIARDGEEGLASLQPPDERLDAFGRYLDSRGEVVALLEGARAAAADEDGEAYEQARRDAIAGSGKRADLARRAGLPDCARTERG